MCLCHVMKKKIIYPCKNFPVKCTYVSLLQEGHVSLKSFFSLFSRHLGDLFQFTVIFFFLFFF